MDLPQALVVDDDPAVREAIADGLRDEGFEVFAASRAYEALKALDVVRRLDVVLLDLLMPDVPGESLLPQLRKHPAAPGAAIIATSASPDRLQHLRRKADALLPKPFGLDSLCDVVGQLCARTADAGVTFGVHLLDVEHAAQSGLTARLIETLRPGHEKGPAAAVLEELVDLTRGHFAAEGVLMHRHGYPDSALHAHEHSTWVAEAEELRASATGTSRLKLGTGLAVKNSIEHHIRTFDAVFARHLFAQGEA